MAFEWPRIHKWEENLYNYSREWVEEYLCDHYGVEDTNDLTEEQIDEIQTFMDEELGEYSPLRPGFYDIINWWESQ